MISSIIPRINLLKILLLTSLKLSEIIYWHYFIIVSKCPVYALLENSVKNEDEKQALKLITPNDNIQLAVKNGYFGEDRFQPFSININGCKGGYLRAFDHSESIMLVLSPREIEQNKERTFTENEILQLQSKVCKITGDGEVMQLFNSLLGISAGSGS